MMNKVRERDWKLIRFFEEGLHGTVARGFILSAFSAGLACL